MKIPSQYLPVMPYLILSDARAFIAFAKTVFGATEQLVVPADEDRIMHAELRIQEAVIMLADATDTWQQKSAGMFLFLQDVDRVYKTALENGARELMPPALQDYGYTAGFEDAFGNQWWIVAPEQD